MNMRENDSSIRRVLFLFSDTGGGHRSSASAVAEALNDLYDERVHTELVDVLTDYAPWPLYHMGTLYPYMVRMNGIFWAAGYRVSNGRRRIGMFTRACWPWVRSAIFHLLQDHPADVIVSCHPVFNHVTLRALAQTGCEAKLITLITDLATAHAFWITPEIPYCLVPTEEGRQRALACGMTADRISVVGLPTSPHFVAAAEKDPIAVRQQLGLKPDLPVVLLVSGGEGMGPVYRLSKAVADSNVHAQLVVITGRNEQLRAKLSAETWSMPVRVEGFVHNMHEWMRAADLLVTKAGPSTVCEALVMGLPMLISGALPGQEQPTVDYVVQSGAGVWTPTPGQIAKAVRELLAPGNPKLAQMAANAQSLARPDAARRIAEVVWATANNELDR
ncbi:MAG: glycosyltransferase [Chloroflexi bacterium]|nr:glycosyltransferase [Chloroflexota bacterium]